MIIESTMEEESKEYNEREMKKFLNGLLYPIKAKVEKFSYAKGMWDTLQHIHSKLNKNMNKSWN